MSKKIEHVVIYGKAETCQDILNEAQKNGNVLEVQMQHLYNNPSSSRRNYPVFLLYAKIEHNEAE